MRAVIDDAAGIFTLINTFVVLPQRQDAVVKSLRDFTEQHARFCSGFVGASVHASLDGQRVVNYVQWESRDDLGAMMAGAPAKALRCSPAMAAGISQTLWSMEDVVALIDARAEAPKARGAYKPRQSKAA